MHPYPRALIIECTSRLGMSLTVCAGIVPPPLHLTTTIMTTKLTPNLPRFVTLSSPSPLGQHSAPLPAPTGIVNVGGKQPPPLLQGFPPLQGPCAEEPRAPEKVLPPPTPSVTPFPLELWHKEDSRARELSWDLNPNPYSSPSSAQLSTHEPLDLLPLSPLPN